MLPVIDQCDAIVMATPVYNHQMSAMAKAFEERFYPFFNVQKNMSNTTKSGKKAAFIMSCWAGPQDVYKTYADWTLEGYSQIGVTERKSLIFGQILERGAVREHTDYMMRLHELAGWLKS